MIHELVVSGLKSTQNIEESLRRHIHNLLETAPSDASASAKLRKVKKGYEGLIEIFSSQGKFIAQGVSENIPELVKALTKQLHSQFKDWRGNRFQKVVTPS
jgi:hypothetical protein